MPVRAETLFTSHFVFNSYSLKHTLKEFEDLHLPAQFLEKFPDSITLDQTVAVWKHIVFYQEKMKQE